MALVESGADLALKCGSGAVVGTPVVGTAVVGTAAASHFGQVVYRPFITS